jgi:hypothetical protein
LNYFLVDKSGQYYLRQNDNGDYVPVKNIMLANSWKQQSKAKNVLDSCLNKNLRGRYKVIGIEIEDEVLPELKPLRANESFSKSIAAEQIADGETDKWVTSLGDMKVFIADSEARRDELESSLSEVDKEITDIEHYIEFGKFNAYQGYLAFNMLKQRLMKRRKIKDELIVLQQIGECKITTDKINSIQQAIHNLNNRKYTPRVLSELFEEEAS